VQFTDEDLDAAVAAGAISPQDAAGFRVFVERRRAAPAADEESFRLLTGFSDIFVAIALGLVLSALSWLSAQFLTYGAGFVVAAASWALAEFFTRRRRMALPSILLLASFVFSTVAAAVSVLPLIPHEPHGVVKSLIWGGAGAIAAFLHWRRFKVPVTVAAGALTVGAAAIAAVATLTQSRTASLSATLLIGLLVFALALAWDASDPLRKTRRADVAFWLHLLAAPAIVHPVFALLGFAGGSLFFPLAVLADSAPSPGPQSLFSASVAVEIYVVLALVALIVDRRALMVSGLLYLIYAMNAALKAGGAPTMSFALSALVVGAGLLLLSAFWATARRGALRLTPLSWRERLPPAA
jgi:hypothetical protein